MIDIETKVCKKCNKEYPKTSEYFRIENGNKDGLGGQCKECAKCFAQQYRKDNAVVMAAKAAKYYQDNKETEDKRSREWIEKNREYVSARSKRYQSQNKDAITKNVREYHRIHQKHLYEYARIWRLEHKEYVAEVNKVFYDKNKELYAQNAKVYRRGHREEKRIYDHKRKAIMLSLPHTLTAVQWVETKQYFNDSCAYCGSEVPLEQDHLAPMINGGEYSKDNIIPACKSCNCSKGPKDFFQWYPKYKHYSKAREKAILTYLGYKNRTQQFTLTI